ncbi:MAG TPA: hypothetical protein VND93_26975 [Myxococcales bacterium]|nr:hypothetical protein [Myxococcales bacterium]
MRLDSAARALSAPAPAPTPSTASSSSTNAATRAAAVPEPAGKSPKSYDGMFLGAGGQIYNPASTSVADVPAIKPQNGEPKGLTIYVNGVGAQPSNAIGEMQKYANTTGNQVVGVYNATEGSLKDIIQAAGDKFHIGHNPAADQLANLVHDTLRSGQPIHIAGFSQGGAIVERALSDVKNRLMLEDGMSKGDAERLMGNITAETFGGAGSNFVDGPKYTHYVNRADIVPQLFGVGMPLSHPGRGADVRTFNSWNPFSAHSWDKYMAQWRPPNQSNGLGGAGGGGGGGAW